MKLPMLSTYLNLCAQVYDLSKPKPSEDAYAFYRGYVAECKHLILEPMCGTGRFLLPLVEEGFTVSGFDASHHMLSALHEKAKHKNITPHIWHGFLENLDSIQKYGLIFIPSGSFGLITDRVQAKHCLQKIYDALENNGVFVFEVETLNAVPEQLNVWRGTVYQREDGKNIIASFLDLEPLDTVGTVICKYELVDDQNFIETEIEMMKIKLYESSELISLLESVGFKQVALKKAFDKNRLPEPGDAIIIAECVK